MRLTRRRGDFAVGELAYCLRKVTLVQIMGLEPNFQRHTSYTAKILMRVRTMEVPKNGDLVVDRRSWSYMLV